MRGTLDWDERIPASDEPGHSTALDALRDRFEGRPWELRKSSSGEGWHFVLYENFDDTGLGFAQSTEFRRQNGDDEKRIRLDEARWEVGSPFMQVLFRQKYMDRSEWPAEAGTGYSSGLSANVVEQSEAVKAAPERERIKGDDGRLDYRKIARLLADRYGTISSLADKQGVSRSTVYRWIEGQSQPSDGNRKGLRRKARSQALGHYSETEDGSGAAAEEVRWIDPDDERRTLVEYVDVPMDFDVGGDDREYGLLNIHTGSYNDNHTDRQLHAVHNDVADRTLDILSPTNPKTGTSLNLDEQNTHFIGMSGWSREADSVNYERELLDDGEAAVYLDNLPPVPAGRTAKPRENILFEIILWDEGMTEMEWHVIGLWTGSRWQDATILRDEGLGSWGA